MITLRDVLDTLEDLESQPKSYETAEKLAVMLYLREHLTDSRRKPEQEAVKNDFAGDSEFLRIAVRGDPRIVWPVLDELMETVKITTPRVYDAVMRKLGDRL